MKKIHRLILNGLICIFFTLPCFSQSPYIYEIPTTAHALKLKKKRDLSFSAGTLLQDHYNESPEGAFNINPSVPSYFSEKYSSNFQLAYSIFEQFSVSFNHDRIKTKNRSENRRVFNNSHLTGIGVGTYFPIKFRIPRQVILSKKEKKTSPKNGILLFDFHLGYSRGKINNHYLFGPGNVQLNLQKYYLQGGIHYLGKYLDLSYMLKCGKLNYLNGQINGRTDLSDAQTLNSIINVSNFFIWENTLKAELKISNFGIFYQWSHTSNHEFSAAQWVSTLSSFGIAVRFSNLNFKNKKE